MGTKFRQELEIGNKKKIKKTQCSQISILFKINITCICICIFVVVIGFKTIHLRLINELAATTPLRNSHSHSESRVPPRTPKNVRSSAFLLGLRYPFRHTRIRHAFNSGVWFLALLHTFFATTAAATAANSVAVSDASAATTAEPLWLHDAV